MGRGITFAKERITSLALLITQYLGLVQDAEHLDNRYLRLVYPNRHEYT